MAASTPIFEQSTSALYYSNDGRLHLVTVPGRKPRVTIDTVHTLQLDGVEVFRTTDRVKADAFIAGYDLATTPA